MNSPIFKIPERFQVIASPDGGHLFVSLLTSLRVHSEKHADLLVRILPLLTRGATLDMLSAVVTGESSAEVLGILDKLRNHGLLEEGRPSAIGAAEPFQNTEQERFFANFASLDSKPPSLSAAEISTELPAQRKLADARVMVVGLGRIGSRLVCSLAHAGVGTILGTDPAVVAETDLLDSGYDTAAIGAIREQWLSRVVERIKHGAAYRPLGLHTSAPQSWHLPDALDLLILCDDRFDPDRYDGVNRLCLDHALTWISYRSFGTKYEIGPTIVPRQTACFNCFELRKSANFASYDDNRDTWRSLAARNISLGSLNVTIGSDLLALEAVKILTGFSRPLTHGSLFSFDLLTMETGLHPVLKIPRCPQCSPAAAQRPALIIWPPGDGFEDV